MVGGVHGGGHVWPRGACVVWGDCMAGGMRGRVCVAGGMCGGVWGGRGMCGRGGGMCMAGETATAVDGTHPTGTHSCLLEILTN